MKTHWHRAIFFLLMIGLPLFTVAATTMSFCQASQQEMLDVSAIKEATNDCSTPCSSGQRNMCESGQACGASCAPPLASAPRQFYSVSLLLIYQNSVAALHPSHIAGTLDRPPRVG
jgi:hypothetical protein